MSTETYCSTHGEQETGSQFCPVCGNKLGKRASYSSLLVCVAIACVIVFIWVAIQRITGANLPVASIWLVVFAVMLIVSAVAKLISVFLQHKRAIKKVLLWSGVFVVGAVTLGLMAGFVAWILGCSLAMAVLILLVGYIAAKQSKSRREHTK
ncbi:MAG TPA: hypothetical protein VEJ67_00565 [Candidatus Cybelea sp.]|nr:hypothetical protein [Candidatus Cybelea sp.]